ncbi:hypothetical protein QQ045_030610 [Rhodiola kirilowii]
MPETRNNATMESLVSLATSYSGLSSRTQTLEELIHTQAAAIQRQAEESARYSASIERMMEMFEQLMLPRADKQTTEAQPKSESGPELYVSGETDVASNGTTDAIGVDECSSESELESKANGFHLSPINAEGSKEDDQVSSDLVLFSDSVLAGATTTPWPVTPIIDEPYMSERIPVWIAGVGYVIFSIISIIDIPLMFHEVKWYYVVVMYLLAPALGFCNTYGASLTNMNMGYNYGKVALFVIAAMAGNHSGVVAGHIRCGLIKSIISICSDLTHDFKTGHLTLISPRSMLVSQAISTAMGCIAPFTFLLFYNAFDIGNPNGEYKAPYALIYRNMAILGVHGFSALPQHCLQLCYRIFGFSMASNLVRDFSPKPIAKCIHLPTAMAVPFLVEAYFAIDMCVVERYEIHHIIELDNQRLFFIMSTTNELYPGYIGVGQRKKLEIF